MKIFRTTTFLLLVVFTLTACGSGDGGGSTDPVEAADGTIEIEASDLAFDPTQLSATAGEIEVVMDNVGSAEHDFAIAEAGDEVVVQAAPGESATGTIELEAGTYTFYCAVPGHREAGMEGTLTVQ